MGYKRALLLRWSRRDRLTVLVVAVTVAFLVGSGLLLTAAGTQTTTIASEFTSSTTATYYDSYAEARASSGEEAIVLPTTEVTLAGEGTGGTGANATVNGSTEANASTRRVIAVPEGAPETITDASVPWREARIPPRPESGVYGPVESARTVRLEGPNATADTTLSPHPTNGSLAPDSWFVANVSLVDRVGPTGAFVIESNSREDGLGLVPERGTAILGALLFFLAGMNQLLRVLSLATVGGAVLVLVVVYNVVRMTVRDRMGLITVIRSTGGTPRQVLALFGVRAGLLVAAGVGLGYAFGVIFTNAVVNVAVYAGVPIALSPVVSPTFLRLLAPALGVLAVVGVLAGLGAAWPATRREPSRLSASNGPSPSGANGGGWDDSIGIERVRETLRPDLLDARALVPTAMTLAVFAVVVILVTSLVGAVAPLANAEGGTIVQAGAPHPIASRVDSDYATVLRSQGIEASPEILLAQASDGEPYLARGANYTAFAQLTDTRMIRGHAPRSPDQAVIGTDLAHSLGIEVGDAITLGGSTSPGLDRVEIVGVFEAPGIYDDEVIVPLATAHHLSNRPGVVQFIRTSAAAPSSAGNTSGEVTVTGVRVDSEVVTGERYEVRVSLQNFAEETRTYPLLVRAGNDTRERRVEIDPGGHKDVTVNFDAGEPGNRTVQIDSYTRNLTVRQRNALELPTVPDRAPPGAELLVPVRTVNNRSVPNATITISGQQVETNERGVTGISLPDESGTYTLTASKGNRTASTEIDVADGAPKSFVADVGVTPQAASVLTRPAARVTLANPWTEPVSENVTVVSPTRTVSRQVRLEPGETVRVKEDLAGGSESDQRASPGSYTVRVLAGGETLARASYTIEGDDRLFAALASSGQYSSGSGVGRAVQSIFGNLQLLLVAMVLLAGLTTIGATTATFAQTVHARRRAIGVHRATGATYRKILRQVLLDAVRLSAPATLLALLVALVAARVLGAIGALTLFGIRLSPSAPLPVLAGTALGALLLSSLSAVLATVPFLLASPTTLLADSDAGRPHASGADERSSRETGGDTRGLGADD
jgi:ABC-type lipoprotein release transport system permease subunit